MNTITMAMLPFIIIAFAYAVKALQQSKKLEDKLKQAGILDANGDVIKQNKDECC